MDFDDMMEDSECENCGENGYRCRCTREEVEEARQEMQADYDAERRRRKG